MDYEDWWRYEALILEEDEVAADRYHESLERSSDRHVPSDDGDLPF